MVIVARVGRYEKLIFRFDAEYDAYDVRVVPDIAATSLNFVVLAHGVCLHLNDKDELEIFPARTGTAGMKVIADPALGVDCLLLCDGPQVLMARGGALSGFAMRCGQGKGHGAKPPYQAPVLGRLPTKERHDYRLPHSNRPL